MACKALCATSKALHSLDVLLAWLHITVLMQIRVTPMSVKKLEHQGIKIQLLGQIELASERGVAHEFVSLGAQAGCGCCSSDGIVCVTQCEGISDMQHTCTRTAHVQEVQAGTRHHAKPNLLLHVERHCIYLCLGRTVLMHKVTGTHGAVLPHSTRACTTR